MQAADATIRSNDSTYLMGNNFASNKEPTTGKVKAYVDFTEFHKNYQEYISDNDRESFQDIGEIKLAKQNSKGSSTLTDWVLVDDNTD